MEVTRLFAIDWYDETLRDYADTEFSCDTAEEAAEWFYDEFCKENSIDIDPDDVCIYSMGYTVYDGDDTFDFYCE